MLAVTAHKSWWELVSYAESIHTTFLHTKKKLFLQKLTFLGLVSGSKQGTMLNLSDSSGTENVKSNLSVNFNIHWWRLGS